MSRCGLILLWLLLSASGHLTHAALPNTAALHAWYEASSGLQASGAAVTAWQDNHFTASGKSLDRVVGNPRLWRVQTKNGPKAILRLDGNSALWQSASAWGTLSAPRTILCFARITNGANGVLCDSSSPAASEPAQLHGATPGWRVLRFDQTSARFAGFVLGANASLKNGLQCDLAELLIFCRRLSPAEVEEHSAYLRQKWGIPTDLPQTEQCSDTPGFAGATSQLLRKHGTENVLAYRMPGLATTPKGTLLAVFDQRRSSAGELPGDIDIGLLRSTDQGDTWQPMQTILDFDAAAPHSRGNGVSSPCIFVDHQTSRIFVAALWSHGDHAWNGSGPGLRPDQTGQLVLTHSDDEGLTWSNPQSITPQVKRPQWRLCLPSPGSGLQLKDGTLLLPAQYREASGTPRACLLFSHDHGDTWSVSPPAIPQTRPTSEAQAAELADGTVLFSIRDESRSGQRAWCRFDPQTQTWSEPWFALPDPSSQASLLAHPDGSLLFCNPASPKNRSTLTVRTSFDYGHTWSNGRLLDPRASNASCMSTLQDGRIALLYEGEEGLHLTRFWPETTNLAAVAQPRPEASSQSAWWLGRNALHPEGTTPSAPELLFLGDALTQGWEDAGAKIWKLHYESRNAANYGFAGDSTQHLLWRMEQGALDGLQPKLIVLQIGAMNVKTGNFTPDQIAAGIGTVLERLRQKCPTSRILLLALFPQEITPGGELRRKAEALNALLPPLADGKRVFLLNINHVFLNPEGVLSHNIAHDPMHLTTKGYALWAEAIEPTVQSFLESAP